jgi:hypothetical protein
LWLISRRRAISEQFTRVAPPDRPAVVNRCSVSTPTGMLPQIKIVRGLDGGVGVSDRDMHGPVFLKAGILRKFNKLPAGTSSSIS